MNWQTRKRIGMFAWSMAWFGLVMGQLHALARHRTEDGKADLDMVTTRFWAKPAGKALKPLLDWANPDAVYVTYGKLWLPVFAATALAAAMVYRSRQPHGFERIAWRVSIVGYVLACVGIILTYWTQWTGFNMFNDWGLAADIPGMLLTFFGSTALGITLLRKGFTPKVPALLLALVIPGLFTITAVTSLGNAFLPVAFAFGILGRMIARDPSYVEKVRVSAPERQAA